MWMDTADDLAEKTWQTFAEDNPIRLIIDTGMGRITKNTIKQLSAMRGINVDPRVTRSNSLPRQLPRRSFYL